MEYGDTVQYCTWSLVFGARNIIKIHEIKVSGRILMNFIQNYLSVAWGW